MKRVRIVFAGIVLIGLVGGSLAGTYGGGSGTAEDPYQIWTAEQMNQIGLHEEDWDMHFVLMDDIDLGQYDGKEGRESFNCIGYTEGVTMGCLPNFIGFSGVFSGNGHKVLNFTYDYEDGCYVGLFGVVYGGEIKNLGLIEPNVNAAMGNGIGSLAGVVVTGRIRDCYAERVDVCGGYEVGGLVGNNGSWLCWPGELAEISNCHVTGEVVGDRGIGGLVGDNAGNIINCQSNSRVIGSSNVGGFVGNHALAGNPYDGMYWGIIEHCFSIGDVLGSNDTIGGLVGGNSGDIATSYSSCTAMGDSYVGGLVGENYGGTITDSHSTSTVTGQGYNVGGLAGLNVYGDIIDSYSNGMISGDLCVGGLCGTNGELVYDIEGYWYNLGGTISNCYSNGRLTGNREVGGLVGGNVGWITNSYNMALVTGEDAVGGLVGQNGGWVETQDEGSLYIAGMLTNCYSAGTVEGCGEVGGLVGNDGYYTYSHDTIAGSFWDVQTSGQEHSAGGEGKTTAEMKTLSPFTNANWDFINTWDIGENQTYPYLRTHSASDLNKDKIVNFLDLSILAEQWLKEE